MPPFADAAYPHGRMAAPSRPRRSRRSPDPALPPPAQDPDGGFGRVHDLLTAAVEEAARLLDADGAMVYLMDPATGRLKFAHDAGIESPRSREWIRGMELDPGTGMFGTAVAQRAVVVTSDYSLDRAFRHAAAPDRVVADVGIRSMVVAPLVSGSEVFGALGTFSARTDAFSLAQIALVRSLADHAAAAMANTRLIEELDRSRGELDRSREALARRAGAEQALREIAARITTMRDPAAILQEVVELASRLVGGDGAILDLLEPSTGRLRWAYDDGVGRLFSAAERANLWITVGDGATGTALAEDRVVVAGDELEDLFPPGPDNTEFYARTGFRSMIAAPITGEAGPLGVIEVYAVRPGAFVDDDATLVRALAGQAAIAITNARLIAELAESRSELARTADAERTLREIAASVSAMRDKDAILQAVSDAATRLLRSNGAMIDLIEPDDQMSGAWTFRGADGALVADRGLLEGVELETDAGVSGLTLRTHQVEWTGDYLADERFSHTPERDRFVRDGHISSVIAAPLLQRGDVLGAITVYSERPDAFDPSDAAVLAGLADQAAVAIANAHLIAELERSREENARRADAERTLRGIAARVSAILDPAEVLDRIVVEAARLLESDGARIDLWDESISALRWAFAAGSAMAEIPEWGRTGGLKPRQAVAGLAFAEQAPVMTADYLADDRFRTTPEIADFVRRAGIRAVISTPLIGEAGDALGVLSVVSRKPGAYVDADVEVLTALATHAAIAITNANLMEQLGRSRADIERRAEAERSLRQIAARISALREPDEVLQHVVDEARRLLRADGALIDQYDPESQTLQWAYDAGLPEDQREAVKMTNLHLGQGVAGKAVAERRTIHVGDYLRGEFEHDELADSLAVRAGVRDLIVAPVIGEAGPLGAIEVLSRQADAFDALDEAVLGGLAEQAAIAITNARLIDELERSRVALGRRAETERSLRDITARIAALRDPDEVLERVVEDAKRLLASDGAHLTRITPDGASLIPVVVAGGADEPTRAWLLGMRFPLGGGINGLAAQDRVPTWTSEYATDPRIPHDPEDQDVARRLGLVGMAAAPLRAPGGDVIGTLAISTTEPRAFEADDLDLLQGLADQAAIALTNSNLVSRLTHEEARFRGLVQTTPDVIWRADADGVFTFMADNAEALFGYPSEAIVGQPFAFLTDPASMPTAVTAYAAVGRDPGLVERVPLTLVRSDGSTFAAEVTTTGVFEDGRWVGAQGMVRDVSERERLHRELRESEERYRYLVQNAPDLIWSIGPDARLTFLSDAVERLTGLRADELVGQHFGAIVHDSSNEVAEIDWTSTLDAPSQEVRGRLNLRHRDGSPVPAEFIAIAVLGADGRFAGANGSVRDMRERDRLERELSQSEERYRFLVEHSPDVVFATDADGRFTFLSAAIERMTGYDTDELIGQHFSTIVDDPTRPVTGGRWEALVADPRSETQATLVLRGRDGRLTPVDVRAVGVEVDGAFAGIQGASRDISDQMRLEAELRRQAGELAAGEERAHLARELHDSVTQALFSMTLVSRSVELLLERDPEAAREQLTQLRDLQREALAEMRALIFELRPGNLEQDGLVRALKTHATALQGRLGLPIVVESDLTERLPLAAEEALYRIAQEALHNVVKHAVAHQVRVEVRRHHGGVRLRVEDDGKGFDPTSVAEGHLGLAGMRVRAERLGAVFACTSRIGQGTTVEVVLDSDALAGLATAAAPVASVEPASIRDG
jgi:PAS domain S-box-containing protein